MDKPTYEHDPLTNDSRPARRQDPLVVGLAIIGALVLLSLVSTLLAAALKLALGLLAGAIGLAAGLFSLLVGLGLGAVGLLIGLIGAVAGFLVTPPGLVLIAIVIYTRTRQDEQD